MLPPLLGIAEKGGDEVDARLDGDHEAGLQPRPEAQLAGALPGQAALPAALHVVDVEAQGVADPVGKEEADRFRLAELVGGSLQEAERAQPFGDDGLRPALHVHARAAGPREVDAARLRFEHDRVHVALAAGETARDREGAGDVGPVAAAFRGGVDEQQVALAEPGIVAVVVQDRAVASPRHDRSVAELGAAGPPELPLQLRLHLVLVHPRAGGAHRGQVAGGGSGARPPQERQLPRRLHDPQLGQRFLQVAGAHPPGADRPPRESVRARVGVHDRLSAGPLPQHARQLVAIADVADAEELPGFLPARDVAHPDRVLRGELRHEQALGPPVRVEEQRIAGLLHAGQVEEVRSLPVLEVDVAVAQDLGGRLEEDQAAGKASGQRLAMRAERGRVVRAARSMGHGRKHTPASVRAVRPPAPATPLPSAGRRARWPSGSPTAWRRRSA